MNDLQTRQAIESSLHAFATRPLAGAGVALLEALGYRSQKRLLLKPNTPEIFVNTFSEGKVLNAEQAVLSDWQSVDVLFQLTDEEIRGGGNQQFLFESKGRYNGAVMESYLFLAIALNKGRYTRTELSGITRAINRLFRMPVMILFRHGETLTLAVINRRLHKRDESRDVLEKVTLIKDINFARPHRAHIEILSDLNLETLYEKYHFSNFPELHEAWRKTLDISELNKRFFQEVANWYFWAVDHTKFPRPKDVKDADSYQAQSVIRLITRLVFCWFLKEKGLIPSGVFDEKKIYGLLNDEGPKTTTYYKAILQNLFFATLSQEQGKRVFRREGQNFMSHNLYRYRSLFKNPDSAIALFSSIPFLNGGLFECLDKTLGTKEKPVYIRIDGFSDRTDNPLSVPDLLFFGEERDVDLNDVFGTRSRRYRVRGIIHTLDRYKFTVEENTPIDEEVALDPELLGKVFENLLAQYNPETGTTARKQTGSFYTPREVVDFMVDQTLIASLQTKINDGEQESIADLEPRLRQLLAYDNQAHQFTPDEVNRLVQAIDALKILDPACGSGAFPMGALQKLVFVLGRLDPENILWKAKQISKAAEIPDVTVREHVTADIEQAFNKNELNYGRKLYLIENCIYGVDIQSIACQIAKLRFFISLVVDQRVDAKAPNLGVRPLPNLETNFVAADSLMDIERPVQGTLRSSAIDVKEAELRRVREAHFNARTPATKLKYREQDQKLRSEIAQLLQHDGFPSEVTEKLSKWDPYDQNSSADFFDPEWMFSIRDGFDVVVGNPPYVRQEQIKELKPKLRDRYECYSGTADLYVYFYERGIRLLRQGGGFSFISSNKWMRSAYGEKLREWLVRNARLKYLIDFGDAPVFTAIAYPCIVVLTRDDFCASSDQPQLEDAPRVFTWEPGPPVEQFAQVFREHSFALPQNRLKPDGWRLESGAKLNLLDRIRAASTPLGEYVNGRFYRGILTGLNEAFVIDGATRKRLIEEHPSSEEIVKPFLRGRDVKRWSTEFQKQYLIKIESSENVAHPWTGKGKAEAEKSFARTYPAVHEHFRPLRKALIDRQDQGRYFWELRACAYWHEFEQPKIVVPAIAEKPQFAPDWKGFYSNNKTTIFVPPSIEFALAVANSSVAAWVAQQTFATKQGGFFDFEPRYSSTIPVPKLTPLQVQMVECLVRIILLLNQTPDHAQTSHQTAYFEQLVNGLMYEAFFADELHAQSIVLFKFVEQAKLPDLRAIPKTRRLGVAQEAFERIYDLNHPIRSCLFSLRALEFVRIIEGEA